MPNLMVDQTLQKEILGLSAVILVGGFGTRIRHITGSTPKPLANVCGKPFLHWIFQSLKARGIDNVYLLTHFAADQIENFAKSEESKSFRIHCVKEDTPLGTGGAVLDLIAKTETLSNTFLLLNGDSLLMEYSLDCALDTMKREGDAIIFGVSMNDASRYGTLHLNKSGQLLAFKEKAPGTGVINTGTYLFARQAFTQIVNLVRPLSLELDVIPSMIECEVKIKGVVVTSPFIDIGTEESLADAEMFVRDNFASK